MAELFVITIITPVYNGEARIKITLESMLQQRAAFEHVVMDGMSSDKTVDVAREYVGTYSLRIRSERDDGIFDAVEKGIRESRGDILAWINAGDFYLPWTLAVVQSIFASRPDVEWITGIPSWFFEESGTAMTATYAPVYSQSLIRRGWYSSQRLGFLQQESMFWRRSLWDRSKAAEILKGQGRGKGYAMDYWLWRRFAEHAPLHTVATVFSCFAISADQITSKHAGVYNAECGLGGSALTNPPWGRLLNRAISTMRYKSIIRPGDADRS